MTEAKDIYKTLLVGSFLSSVWMQSQKSEHFTAVLAGKVKDTCQWATSCTSWRNLLCQLLSNPLPSSRLLCDTCCFSYLKIYAHCLLKRCCMYLWGWQHWSCLLCNGQPESALTQAVLGDLMYATCKEQPGQCISWKGSEWGLSIQKSLFDQRLLFGLWIPCFFPLTYEPNIHLGSKLCSLCGQDLLRYQQDCWLLRIHGAGYRVQVVCLSEWIKQNDEFIAHEFTADGSQGMCVMKTGRFRHVFPYKLSAAHDT